MNVSTEIHLDKFKPRHFQLALCDAVENRGFKKILAIWPRRAGKDLCAWNLMIRQAVRKVGVYMYCLPTFKQARLVIFDNITNDHFKMIDYIPKELIKSINSQELKIALTNGSIIQLIGSDSYDTSLVGTNPRMVIMSEYALADPRAYHFVRPILNANGGTMIILSTPRGKNSLWEIYNIAKESPDWFCNLLTLEDTKHISWEDIQKEIDSGEISEDLAAQEYLCSFEMGVEGSIYAKAIDKMRVSGQISQVPYENTYPVDTSWDIGVADTTSIIFFQRVNNIVRIIDCYENNRSGIEHYVNVLAGKGYFYGRHWLPHDVKVQEWGTGLTRVETAARMGIKFEMRTDKYGKRSSALPGVSIEDGIEACRNLLPRVWIDEVKCKQLIKSLENYRYEWDSKRKVYTDKPYHDINSNYADSFRYLTLSLSLGKYKETTPEELDRRYREAQGYGSGLSLGSNNGFFNGPAGGGGW